MPRHAVPCQVVPWYVMPCCAMPWYISLAMSCCVCHGNMQVSAANDYRLQDQTLTDVLATPALRSAEAKRMQMQQGVMLVGPRSHEALAISWSQTVGSFQTQVLSWAAASTVISPQQSTTRFCRSTICLVLFHCLCICVSLFPWHDHVAYHCMHMPSMFGTLRADAQADMQF